MQQIRNDISKHDCKYLIELSNDKKYIEIKCICKDAISRKYQVDQKFLDIFGIEKVSGKCDCGFSSCKECTKFCFDCNIRICDNCRKLHNKHLLANAIINPMVKASKNEENGSNDKEMDLARKISTLENNQFNFNEVYKKTIAKIKEELDNLEKEFNQKNELNKAAIDLLLIMLNRYKRSKSNLLYDRLNSIISNINPNLNPPEIYNDLFSKKFTDFKEFYRKFNLIKTSENKELIPFDKQIKNNCFSILTYDIQNNNNNASPIIFACNTGLFVARQENKEIKDTKCNKLSKDSKDKKCYKIVKKGYNDEDNPYCFYFFACGDEFIEIHQFALQGQSIHFGKIMEVKLSRGKLLDLFAIEYNTVCCYYTENNVCFYFYGDYNENPTNPNGMKVMEDKNLIPYAANSKIISGLKLNQSGEDNSYFLFVDENNRFYLYSTTDFANIREYKCDISFEKKCAGRKGLYQFRDDIILLGYEGGILVLKLKLNLENYGEEYYNFIEIFGDFKYEESNIAINCICHENNDIYCGLSKHGIIQLKFNQISNAFDMQKHWLESNNTPINEIYCIFNELVILNENTPNRLKLK